MSVIERVRAKVREVEAADRKLRASYTTVSIVKAGGGEVVRIAEVGS